MVLSGNIAPRNKDVLNTFVNTLRKIPQKRQKKKKYLPLRKSSRKLPFFNVAKKKK